MITFLRKFRQKQSDNNISKYLFYAIGEIILVVVGILIALQIDNNNDRQKERSKELLYLSNLRKDLVLNIIEIDKYIKDRHVCIESSKAILEYFEGEPITDVAAFNNLCMPIYNWQRFYQVNNTFQELISSGNLTLISNDTIKTILFNLESSYKINKAEEDHFRFDTELLIYQPLYELMDLKVMVESIGISIGTTSAKKQAAISPEIFEEYLKSIKLKNGFTSAVFEFTLLNEQLTNMKQMSDGLIQIIDREVKRD
jgi:hypothetical protein